MIIKRDFEVPDDLSEDELEYLYEHLELSASQLIEDFIIPDRL